MKIIEVKNFSFRYANGNRNSLENVTLDVEEGTFNVLCGKSGCGKSTLLRQLKSDLAPCGSRSGRICYYGQDLEKIAHRQQSQEIGYVLQNPENQIVTDKVWHELAFGLESLGYDTPSIRLRVAEMASYFGIHQWFYKNVSELSGGQKQLLNLAAIMAMHPKLLILDEPTASLNEDDSQALLDLLLKFKEQGMTSIIISHKLNEISYVADKITVIRDGSTIETLDKKVDDFSEQRIIQGMVGREMTDRFPKRPDVRVGAVSMEVKNWTVYHPLYSERKVVDNVSFKIHKGEVVGISGLMGAGRTELAMSIFGKSYGTKISGQIFMNGKEVKLNTVQEAIDNKLAYVTEDRKGNGLILSKSIKMNTSLANMKGISNGQVIDADKEYAVAEEYRKKLKTKCPSVEQNVGNLSGGNQQKVLLAKWMFTEPDILILDEPTRGIDVGAKYEIYCIINDLVAAGKSVIMISSELPEVLGMSDRIYIMNEGKFVGEVGKEEATSELIMSKIVKSGKGA